MDADELGAREGVRDTLARYNLYGDAGKLSEMVELFAPEGELEVDDAVHRGREAIDAFMRATADDLAAATSRPLIRHHVSTVVIDVVDARHARASSYFFVVTERGPDHWGRYRDELVRVGEHWRFARRSVRTDGAARGSWANARRPNRG